MGRRLAGLLLVGLLTLCAMTASAGDAPSEGEHTLFMPQIRRDFHVLAASLPPGVHLVGSVTRYVSTRTGTLHMIGEIVNNTDQSIQSLRISAEFLDSDGQVVSRDSIGTFLGLLPPSDRTCFDLITSQPPDAEVRFDAPTYRLAGPPRVPITVLSRSTHYDVAEQLFTISTTIRNDTGVYLNYVEVVGTLYNSAGEAIACSVAYPPNSQLATGHTANLDLHFAGRGDYADVASYRLQPRGRR